MFQEIPECVFEWFCDIMYADPANRGRTAHCTKLATAQMIAWGWNPPLVKLGTKHALINNLNSFYLRGDSV